MARSLDPRKALSVALLQRGITYREAADEAGVSLGHLHGIARGPRWPSPKMALTIEAAFGVPAASWGTARLAAERRA